MSLAERLFPASELNALRKYTYGGEALDERATKRRRMNSTYSSISTASTAADSGYNSEDNVSSKDSPPALAPEASKPEFSSQQSTASTQKRRRVNSEPVLSSRVPAEFVQRYLSHMHPADRQRYTNSYPAQCASVFSPSSARDADLEIVTAQHQIALARQRLHSYSGPVHADRPRQADLGWTAGPKAACSSNIVTRLFDGCRIMSHERNLLDSLLSPSAETVKHKPAPLVQLTAEEKKEVEKEVNFAGLAMPANLDDEEQEYEPGTYHDEAADSGFEDFFKLDEASTPGEEDVSL